MSADDLQEPDTVVMYLHSGESKERFTEPLTYEAALKRAKALEAVGHNVPAVISIEHASQRKAIARLDLDVDETHRMIKEELARQAASEANRVRDLLIEAVTCSDPEIIRTEAQKWSGYVAATLMEIASRIDVIKEAQKS